MSQLARISAYWLGLTAIDSVVTGFNENRINYTGIVSQDMIGLAIPAVGFLGAVIGIIVQPTVGYLSDFTTSRWGRRKPYIVFGSLLDLVFLTGIATSNSIVALAACVALLAFSTNVARGPFQGYVPDLVAEPQVGLASAMVGMMQVAGNIVGFLAASAAAIAGDLRLGLIAVALIELATMLSVVFRVDNGPRPSDRRGRSWVQIARETWATDILAERSYVWLVTSRLFFLMGGAILVNYLITYLHLSHGMTMADANRVRVYALAAVAVASALTIIPSARLSDRVGRKPLIYVSCVVGGAGVLVAALAPDVPTALVGAALFGASSGTFLAVDWALMTDIIPRASAGRYMGLSNVATGSATPLATILGGVIIWGIGLAVSQAAGPRVAYLVGLALYSLAMVTLRPVVEPRRGQAAAEASGVAASTA